MLVRSLHAFLLSRLSCTERGVISDVGKMMQHAFDTEGIELLTSPSNETQHNVVHSFHGSE